MIVVYYECQIALVAVGKTRNVENRDFLRISNHACGRGENAEIFKILAYYEYQITLVAMRKTREFVKPCPITNIKSRL